MLQIGVSWVVLESVKIWFVALFVAFLGFLQLFSRKILGLVIFIYEGFVAKVWLALVGLYFQSGCFGCLIYIFRVFEIYVFVDFVFFDEVGFGLLFVFLVCEICFYRRC